jgi:hypothetical protein
MTMVNLNCLNIVTIDHMTHIDNLSGILTHGLLAHDNHYKKVDISNREVNNRRTSPETVYQRPIHDYVPFYFNARNAMLYRNQKEFGDAVIVLGFNTSLIETSGTVFANANASCEGTQFSGQSDVLNSYDWERIFSQSWCSYGQYDQELKRQMMAEVLVHKQVAASNLEVIYCNSQARADFISANFSLDGVVVSVDTRQFF